MQNSRKGFHEIWHGPVLLKCLTRDISGQYQTTVKKEEASIIVGIPTTLRAGRSGVRIPVCERYFCVFYKVPGRHWTHPPSSSMRTVVIPWGQRGRGVKLTSPLHLVESYTSPPPILLHGGDEGETLPFKTKNARRYCMYVDFSSSVARWCW